jgi:hypothetical protein
MGEAAITRVIALSPVARSRRRDRSLCGVGARIAMPKRRRFDAERLIRHLVVGRARNRA